MSNPVRLTELTGQGGCSAKIAQADLASILTGIASPAGGDLLVSAETMDDAAVYRLSDDLALVATTDFFPPPVDDPRDYGAIATANALSDIYAMGGTPILLLNLVGFDLANLDGGILRQILEGGAEVASEAGCAVAGGHSIRSPEPIFGCAVLGRVDPRRMMTNASAQAGDRVFLTKPLGTGVILNSHKAQRVSAEVLAGAVATMRQLNRDAARAMLQAGASSATDVTGFGLLGHVDNLARASSVRVRVRADWLPALPGALDLIAQGHIPGGSRRNLELARTAAAIAPGVPDDLLMLACDAQTSGGLVVTIAPGRATRFGELLPGATQIGEVLAAVPGQPIVELA
ncbi:MAG: selenide, water dikinase SelD [Candidatus Dormibacteria bacterium]